MRSGSHQRSATNVVSQVEKEAIVAAAAAVVARNAIATLNIGRQSWCSQEP